MISKYLCTYPLLIFYPISGQQNHNLPLLLTFLRIPGQQNHNLPLLLTFPCIPGQQNHNLPLLLTFSRIPSQQTTPFLPFADLFMCSGSANISFLTICWPFHAPRVSKRRISHILLTFPNARIQQPPRIFHFADFSALAGSASSIKKYICWQKIKTAGAVLAQDPWPHRQFHKFLSN